MRATNAWNGLTETSRDILLFIPFSQRRKRLNYEFPRSCVGVLRRFADAIPGRWHKFVIIVDLISFAILSLAAGLLHYIEI